MGLALIFVSGALDTTAPVLSLPTGTQTGSTTGSGTVTTDEGGTLYFWATENASETAAAIKASGDSQAATVGLNNVVFSGLTAETAYFAHYVEDDASSNESNVVSSTPAFTTTATPADATGGFWADYDTVGSKSLVKRQRAETKRRKAQEIQDTTDRLIALENRRLEEESARLQELEALTEMVRDSGADLRKVTNERIEFIAKQAINRHTFSAMERLERELNMMYEEEEFLIMATQILVNQ